MIPNKGGVLNGPRPSPLKIKKQSSSSSSISKKTHKKPVIIYAHSPKIIHTKANHFKALVQELTGLSHVQDDDDNEVRSPIMKMRTGNVTKEVDNNQKEREGGTTSSLDSMWPLFKMPINSYLAGIPLFTPNLADFLCSPRLLSRSPNIGSSFSPSFIEVMKGLPEY